MATQQPAHTNPWTEDEYLYVGHKRCVYHEEAGELVVHEPGGRATPLSLLQNQGIHITMPLKLRKRDFTRRAPQIV